MLGAQGREGACGPAVSRGRSRSFAATLLVRPVSRAAPPWHCRGRAVRRRQQDAAQVGAGSRGIEIPAQREACGRLSSARAAGRDLPAGRQTLRHVARCRCTAAPRPGPRRAESETANGAPHAGSISPRGLMHAHAGGALHPVPAAPEWVRGMRPACGGVCPRARSARLACQIVPSSPTLPKIWHYFTYCVINLTMYANNCPTCSSNIALWTKKLPRRRGGG